MKPLSAPNRGPKSPPHHRKVDDGTLPAGVEVLNTSSVLATPRCFSHRASALAMASVVALLSLSAPLMAEPSAVAQAPDKPAQSTAVSSASTAMRRLVSAPGPGEGQPNLNALRPEDGWRMVYASVPGKQPIGSMNRLLEVIKTRPEQLAVTVPVFHGTLSGYCQSVTVHEGNVVDCELKVWCNENGLGSEIPEKHGHSLHVLSDGTFNHIVLSLTPRMQEKIVAMENSEVTVAFYQLAAPSPAQP